MFNFVKIVHFVIKAPELKYRMILPSRTILDIEPLKKII